MYRSSEEYEEIVKTITDIYINYNIKNFPVDPNEICKKMGVELVPYSKYSLLELFLLKKKGKSGFYVKGCEKKAPTIYYNDYMLPDGAKRFTIFHELKHFVYNEDSDDDDIDDLADFFSRFFMCPIPYLIMKGIETEEEIVSLFGVSREAADNVISNLYNRKQKYGKKIFEHEEPLLTHLDKKGYELFKKNCEEEGGG